MPRLSNLGKRSLWLAVFCLVWGTFLFLTSDFWRDQFKAYFLGSIEVEAQKTGRFLPPVDEAEVVLLGEGTKTRFEDPSIADYSVVGSATLRGEDAQKVANLWRALRRGEQFSAMCHAPLYGLRFRDEGKLIFETTVCWECQNYSIPLGPGGILGHAEYGFDAKSEDAKALLTFLKQRVPIPEKPSGK
jgi:hypothetical protein